MKGSKRYLDYRTTREYYGVVKRGKIVEHTPGYPIIYTLDEVSLLRSEFPKAKVVKIRMTAEVVSEVIL